MRTLIKMMKLIVRLEKWLLNKLVDEDTVEYEDYIRTIWDHEKVIANQERINREMKL